MCKLLLEGHDPSVAATGVLLRMKDGSEKVVHVNREVILAAGAIQTPQILELSGIGGRSLLESFGLPVFIDNKGVGENLQDHPQTCISYELRDGLPSMDMFRDASFTQAAVKDYERTKSGPVGGVSYSVSYLPIVGESGVLSLDDRKALLDKHIHEDNLQHKLLKEMLSQSKEPAMSLVWFDCQMNMDSKEPTNFGEYVMPKQSENYATILHGLAHPFSRGSCHIETSDIMDHPIINPAYLTHSVDAAIAAHSVMFGDKLMATEPLSSTVIKPNAMRLPPNIPNTLEEAVDVARLRTVSNMHLSSTCSMMPRHELGVVDSKLIVHGTTNIRIVDASVFPLVPLGNIQPTVYAVAERAADMLKYGR